ncbi:MAG: cysteine--tRNA ligase [Candidatus Levybacteria bacterium]|nr:cysteine--tRNA ligase [Candidatus Levybacteria bacterium]
MLKIYNTLTKKVEEFKPINSPKVNIYSCGPTVYDYQHIGHMRRYVGDDILIRVLDFNNFRVKHVMNITDVGHLVSDADTGEDKMEKGARKFNKTVWEIAKMFEEQFFASAKALNIKKPDLVMHATDYIKEQIVFIQALEKKGYTYKIDDGIYFDTSKFSNYNKLSGQNLKDMKAGARVEMVKGKKHPSDFALWKFSPNPSTSSGQPKRLMEWESPFGIGFPGWHIECSTMAIKGLETETLDIHTGGIDHIAIHHTNEIVQSEAATGKTFVKYWMHHNFLLVDGQKMSKSLGNIYTVEDIIKKAMPAGRQGFEPLALRYLYLQTHYRQEANFTFEALESAQTALNRLRENISNWGKPKVGCAEFEERFLQAINNDLNMPEALSIVWELVKSDYPTSAKAESLFKMDQVLGLNLGQDQKLEVPEEIMKMVKEREELRKIQSYHLADQMRGRIKKLGYNVLDTEKGSLVKKIGK